MATLEERVATLEAHADNHTKAIEGLRTETAGLRAETAGLRTETAGLRTDIAELRGELRASVAQLRSEMATRSDLGELRREMGDLRNDMNRRFELIDAKIDRQFMWTVGLMVSGFFVVIGGLAGVAFMQ